MGVLYFYEYYDEHKVVPKTIRRLPVMRSCMIVQTECNSRTPIKPDGKAPSPINTTDAVTDLFVTGWTNAGRSGLSAVMVVMVEPLFTLLVLGLF